MPSLAVATLLFALAGSHEAAPPQPVATQASTSAPAAAERKYCVPVRDSAGRRTGQLTCRTEADWVKILQRYGFEKPTYDPRVYINPR